TSTSACRSAGQQSSSETSRPCSIFFLTTRPPRRSPLFPYTTLFRSTGPSSRSMSSTSCSSASRSHRSAPAVRTRAPPPASSRGRSEEHTSELQSLRHLVCRLLLEKKKKLDRNTVHTTPTNASLHY